jgi:hypothetical protein
MWSQLRAFKSHVMRQFSQVFLGAVLAALPALASDAPPIRSAFGPGEQATYEVSYLGVPAGTAVITVGLKMQQYGQDVWPIVCTAQTELAIFPVKDRYVSYWDFAAGRNVGSEFFADENRKRRREKSRYDAQLKKIFATKQKEGSAPVEVTYDVPEGVVDLAAAAMQVRNQPLSVGQELKVPIFTGLVTYQMTAKVEGKEKLSTRLGEKDTFRVTFTAEWSGMLKAKRALTLWFLDDPSHLPVRFEAELMLGSVVAELSSFYPGRAFTQ